MTERAFLPIPDAANGYADHPLIAHAARNLRDMLGARAVDCAEKALQTMRARGDDDGLAMWLAVHAQLSMAAGGAARSVH